MSAEWCGMQIRLDENCPPHTAVIMNPKYTQAVDVSTGKVYDFKKGKWVKKERR